MKPPSNVNPLIQLWRTIEASQVLRIGMFEYLKVVEITIVQVLGSIEDECTFSTLTFVKPKLCNHLAKHLKVAMGMYF
jgi:hypothetical protein